MTYLGQPENEKPIQEKSQKYVRKFYREIEDYEKLTPEERIERVVEILSEAVIKFIRQKHLDAKENGNKREYSGNQ